MHQAIQFCVFWALAFATLGLALVLLNVYYSAIGNDMVLRSIGQEAAIACMASLAEAAGLWMVARFGPGWVRALFVPALIVGVIYKAAHLEDWSRYDVALLLVFQVVIAGSGLFVAHGQYQNAIFMWLVFGGFLALLGAFIRNL
jgi:hypothetical protein